jgi:hypothetical protein
MKRTLLFFLGGILLFSGCSRYVVVSYDQLKVPSEVRLTMRQGQTLAGVVQEKKGDTLQLAVRGTLQQIAAADVSRIEMLPPVYDEGGGLITETEIARANTHRRTWFYTIGGGALSFGTSLFLSSLYYRNQKDKEFSVINPFSVAGGVLGMILFNRIGAKRDRLFAIEKIRDQRKLEAQRLLEEKRKERERLMKELEALKKEKERIEQEKKKLQEKMKKKKKKE